MLELAARTDARAVHSLDEAVCRLVIPATVLLGAVVEAVTAALEVLRRCRSHPGSARSLEELFSHFGSEEWERVRDRYPE